MIQRRHYGGRAMLWKGFPYASSRGAPRETTAKEHMGVAEQRLEGVIFAGGGLDRITRLPVRGIVRQRASVYPHEQWSPSE